MEMAAAMAGSFHRRSEHIGSRHRALLWTMFIAVAFDGVIIASLPACAHDDVLMRAGPAGHLILIREHAGWNGACETLAPPAVQLIRPPLHGEVCARAETVKIASMFVGTESQCIGHLVRGVQLIYRAEWGYVGDDSLQYAAQYPSVLRTISVKVTVTGAPAGTSGSAPSNAATSPTKVAQSPGPIPSCPVLLY